MLLIPELSTVVLLPFRTGSTSLKAAVLERWPNASCPYRHMERDGLPPLARGWTVLGILRDPVARLHSLWRYMATQDPENHHYPDWAASVRADAAGCDFETWLLTSRHLFQSNRTYPGLPAGYHSACSPLPAARKPQMRWFRPDLGPVEILRFEDPDCIEARLDIRLPHYNAAPARGRAPRLADLSPAARAHMRHWHAGDLAVYSSVLPASPASHLARNFADAPL